MTRTKNRVFFNWRLEQNPSEFLLELKRDYKNVILHGDWNEEEAADRHKRACPLADTLCSSSIKRHMACGFISVRTNLKSAVL